MLAGLGCLTKSQGVLLPASGVLYLVLTSLQQRSPAQAVRGHRAGWALAAWILGGWRTSGAFTYAGGRPMTIGAGGSVSNSLDPFGAVTSVPKVVGTPLVPANVDCWFYSSRNRACGSGTDAFQLQPPGQFGNAGRNILRGPDTRVFDFAVHREFPLREAANLEFRWEVFNLTNTVQFGFPNRDFSSSAAGAITSLAGDPRVMQFALRARF